MTEENLSFIQKQLRNPDLIPMAMQQAVIKAVLRHAKLGNPIATMEEGKVVLLQPEEVFRRYEEFLQAQNESDPEGPDSPNQQNDSFE